MIDCSMCTRRIFSLSAHDPPVLKCCRVFRRYVIVPLMKPDSSPAVLFLVACVVTGATLFGMGAIKV